LREGERARQALGAGLVIKKPSRVRPKFPPVIRAFGCLPGVFVLCGEGC
jgi:hypothetical protein